MSNSQTIKNGVDAAWVGLGDILKEAAFETLTEPTFNFNSGTTEDSGTAAVTCDVALVGSKREAKDRKTRLGKIIAKSKDLPEPTRYTTALIEGKLWRIDAVVKSDDYVAILEVATEA